MLETLPQQPSEEPGVTDKDSSDEVTVETTSVFRADFLKATAPTTAEGIERYLGSGMIKGIGPTYARKLVQVFGATVFDAIEQAPERLQEIAGIGPKRSQRIRNGWAEQKVIREIMLFLHSHGVGTARAVRIYRTYGAEAVQVISENPYRLARDITGYRNLV